MNLKMKDVTYIANGDEVSYWKISEIFIRGNNIASISLKEGLLEKIEEEKELALSVPQLPPQKVNITPNRGGSMTRGRGAPLSI